MLKRSVGMLMFVQFEEGSEPQSKLHDVRELLVQ